jgi:hypothetical protein
MHDFTFVIEVLLLGAGALGAISLLAQRRSVAAPPANSVVAHPPQPRRAQLEGCTVAELQQMARRQGLSRISRLRKAELIDQLINAAAQPSV